MFGKDTKYVFGTQAWEHNDPESNTFIVKMKNNY